MLSAEILLLLLSAGGVAALALLHARRRRLATGVRGIATSEGLFETASQPAHLPASAPEIRSKLEEPQARQEEVPAHAGCSVPGELEAPNTTLLSQHARAEIFQAPQLPDPRGGLSEAYGQPANAPAPAEDVEPITSAPPADVPAPVEEVVPTASTPPNDAPAPVEDVAPIASAPLADAPAPIEDLVPTASAPPNDAPAPAEDVEPITSTPPADVPAPVEDVAPIASAPLADSPAPIEDLVPITSALTHVPAPVIEAPVASLEGGSYPVDDAASDQMPPESVLGPSIAIASLGSETVEVVVPPLRTPIRKAVYRDRRGARRAVTAETTAPRSAAELQPPRQAEAKLRLAIDTIRRYVALSLVLDRPEGFPDKVEIDFHGSQTAEAYDASRYDDIHLDWTPALFTGELRISDAQQRLEWLRSARTIHLFAPDELDLLSVSTARVGVEYAVVCQQQDAAGVISAAESAGSPALTVVDAWKGMPPGWVVLCGYTPTRPIAFIADQRLSSLDPGSGTEIRLEGGLRIRANHYAEGHAPRIIVEPLGPNSRVLLGGRPASQDDTGAWIGHSWDEHGSHLIDVVGGPSLTYTIESDPGTKGVWQVPDDALAPFGMPAAVQAALVGGFVQPLSRQALVAAEPSQSIVALGHRAGAQTLIRRADAPASVAALPFDPLFLVISSGTRRRQGKVLWLGARLPVHSHPRRQPDATWVSAVLGASARRLDVHPSEDDARRAWRSAVTAARRMRRQKP